MSDLQSLKIPELKAKCKERGLKNYSKLSKQQLIDLLTGSTPPAKRPAEDVTPAAVASNTRQDSVKTVKKQKIAKAAPPNQSQPPVASSSIFNQALPPVTHSQTSSVVPLAARNVVTPAATAALPNDDINTLAGQASPSVAQNPPRPIPQAPPANMGNASFLAHTTRIIGSSGSRKNIKASTAKPVTKTPTNPPQSLSRPATFKAPSTNPPLDLAGPPQEVTSSPIPIIPAQSGKTKVAKPAAVISSTSRQRKKVELRIVRKVDPPQDRPASTPPQKNGIALQDCNDARSRKEYLDKSFIPNECVDPKITDGFTVAVRFCISRAFIDFDTPTVKMATRVSKDIWMLKTDAGDVYVLGETGESLGQKLREDWEEWVKTTKTLESVIRTKELYEYPSGIARGFRGDREIARRAVLSGCAGESYCGPKLELAQMDSEWAGRPGDIETRAKRVQLYLPEIKQVISVHTEGMHPDLALVHRSTGYTDMILRETGQVVGTEDGLEERWESVFHGE